MKALHTRYYSSYSTGRELAGVCCGRRGNGVANGTYPSVVAAGRHGPPMPRMPFVKGRIARPFYRVGGRGSRRRGDTNS